MATCEKLQEILEKYNIPATVLNKADSSRVTIFEVYLSIGAKLSALTRITNEIALHLGVENVKIKLLGTQGIVGIEVPNTQSTTVSMKNILNSDEFKNTNSKLSFGIGKDTSGNIVVGDLKEILHLLVAGATGSGKSVFINSLIASLLFKASPKEVRLLLIDPKMVELTPYNGIPHLLAPVITDANMVSPVLKHMVREMDRRYKVFELNANHFNLTIRNIEDFNRVTLKEANMTYIVIVIDELADLVMTANKTVEENIIKLAQKARGAGIFLVIATQRPDRNVVTGLLKANMPSKIAFTVSSSVNSRIILDESGAEKLLGKGDMLYLPTGAMKPTRIQGTFISDDEINKILTFVKENNDPPVFDKHIMSILNGENKMNATDLVRAVLGDVEGVEKVIEGIEIAQKDKEAISKLVPPGTKIRTEVHYGKSKK